jgi:hypothetical protein
VGFSSFSGINFLQLEDGSGDLLLEQSDDVGPADKLLLEVDNSADPSNAEANEDTQNRFNVCQSSGFRALPGELVESGYGEKVLPKFSEPRQMQDFVKTTPDRQEGSPRNEPEDVFITEEVTADDL